MQSRKNRGLIAVLVTACGAILSPLAHADVFTLQQLVNDGATGVTVGDKTFYNFSYQGSATVPATAILVTTSTNPEGLRFAFAWNSTNGMNEDSVIQYCVHVNTTVPQQLINGVGLDFNAAGTIPGTSTFGTVTETISDLSQHILPGGNISVIDFGDSNPNNRDSTTFAVNPPMRDLCVTKDIQVDSAPTASGGGTAMISFVDNTFTQTPEPASLGLLGIGAAMLLRRRCSR